MAGKTKASETTANFKIFEWVINFMKKYGIFNIIVAGFLMVFMSIMMTIAFNPKIVFDRYRAYDEEKHLESFNYRMKSNRSIQLIINDLLNETGAIRCFVVEMHNGKQNSSGLSFNYGSLTYECTVDTAWSVREDYVEFSLDRYPITMYVYENGYWYGSTDDLMCLDRKLALKLEANDAYFLSVTTIYGIKSEIGFLGVTFGPNGCPLDEETLSNKMRKYASQLSPFLDGENVK